MKEKNFNHGNTKVKLGNKKYRISELKKMSEEQLNEIYKSIVNEIGETNLDTLYFKYQENLRLKKEGKLYGSDLLKNNDDEDGEETEYTDITGPTF